MKFYVLILVLVAGAIGGWYYFGHKKGDGPQYQFGAVSRGDLTQVVTATGQLNAVVNVQVGSQISGNIQKLFADFNSEVKAGQVVAQLDAAVYEAALHQAEGELANARAGLELAQINEKRQRLLVGRKIGAEADLDNAVAALHQAEATVAIRRAQMEKAKVDLDRCTIYAPIDGVVISRSVDVGQTVAASLQAPILFTIANDLRKMQIDANVAEADVGSVEVGQSVDFTVDAFPLRTFRGQVAQVRNAPLTVQNVVSYDTVIAVANEDLKLKPGMTANVSIVIAQRQNVLKLPNSGLRFRPPAEAGKGGAPGANRSATGAKRKLERGGPVERSVYVMEKGLLEARTVKLGISDGTQSEVLEGLKENELVITGTVVSAAPGAASGAGNPLSGGGARRF